MFLIAMLGSLALLASSGLYLSTQQSPRWLQGLLAGAGGCAAQSPLGESIPMILAWLASAA